MTLKTITLCFGQLRKNLIELFGYSKHIVYLFEKDMPTLLDRKR